MSASATSASRRARKLASTTVAETGLPPLGKVTCLATIARIEGVAARSPIATTTAGPVAEVRSLISEIGLTLARPPVTAWPVAEIGPLVTETTLPLPRPLVAKTALSLSWPIVAETALSRSVISETTLSRSVVAETALSRPVAGAARTIAAAGLQNLIAAATTEVELAISGFDIGIF